MSVEKDQYRKCAGWGIKIYRLNKPFLHKHFRFSQSSTLWYYIVCLNQNSDIFIHLFINVAPRSKIYQIVAVKQASLNSKTVIKQLNVCPKSVYNIKKLFKNSGTTANKPIPGRKRLRRSKGKVDLSENACWEIRENAWRLQKRFVSRTDQRGGYSNATSNFYAVETEASRFGQKFAQMPGSFSNTISNKYGKISYVCPTTMTASYIMI